MRSATLPHDVLTPHQQPKVQSSHELFPEELDVLSPVKDLRKNVFALTFSHKPQKVLLVEELQVVGLEIGVLV